MVFIALTREVGASIGRCELTHLSRQPIDLERARAQHRAYEDALRRLGCQVIRLGDEPDMPDAVFVEDAAVVLDEVAILTRPGAQSRRLEVESVAAGLSPHRRIFRIEDPGTVDGGDVLVSGRRIFVGLSSRTNREGAEQLARLTEPFGYILQPIPIGVCLHLKSAATAVGERTLLINRSWVDAAAFDGYTLVDVDPAEPLGANALLIDRRLLYPASCPRTAERLDRLGLDVTRLDLSELAKAEGAMTCCSLVFRA